MKSNEIGDIVVGLTSAAIALSFLLFWFVEVIQ